MVANCEYPNGLAFSPDERTLYVANTRSSKYIHALEIDAAGKMVAAAHLRRHERGRRAGHPRRAQGGQPGPRLLHRARAASGSFDPDGKHIGTIKFPEQAVNFAFGGPDLRTLFCCAHTSVYTLRVKMPGNPHPWYKVRK